VSCAGIPRPGAHGSSLTTRDLRRSGHGPEAAAPISRHGTRCWRRGDRSGPESSICLRPRAVPIRCLLSDTGQGEAATMLLGARPIRPVSLPVLPRPAAASSAGWSGRPRCAKPRRGMTLAAGLRLPLVLVIDTAGPALPRPRPNKAGPGRRDRARCLAELVTLDTPTVSVLLGPGQRAGGPALAMVPADRVAGRAARLARAAAGRRAPSANRVPRHRACPGTLRRAGRPLGRLAGRSGIVDTVVAGAPRTPPDEPVEFCTRLSAAIAVELQRAARPWPIPTLDGDPVAALPQYRAALNLRRGRMRPGAGCFPQLKGG